MKLIKQTVVLAVLSTLLAGIAVAQTPREQLQAAVAAYQKNASHENALKVIEIFKQIDPPPSVPEEAREPFVIANTMLKKAPDASTAAKAIEFYDKAIHLAPWWADAYFNRALARETAGQFDKAIDDLNLYLAFKLNDAERREAQDKIYALKAEAELADSKKAEAEKAAQAAAAKPNFAGIWIQRPDSIVGLGHLNSAVKISQDSPGQLKVDFDYNVGDGPITPNMFLFANPDAEVSKVQVIGRQLRFRVRRQPSPENYFDLSLELSDDGSQLAGSWTYTQADTSRGLGYWAQRGRVSVTYTR